MHSLIFSFSYQTQLSSQQLLLSLTFLTFIFSFPSVYHLFLPPSTSTVLSSHRFITLSFLLHLFLSITLHPLSFSFFFLKTNYAFFSTFTHNSSLPPNYCIFLSLFSSYTFWPSPFHSTITLCHLSSYKSIKHFSLHSRLSPPNEPVFPSTSMTLTCSRLLSRQSRTQFVCLSCLSPSPWSSFSLRPSRLLPAISPRQPVTHATRVQTKGGSQEG